jgi:predicted nucleotidyltransferase component of viral defense system
MIGDNHSLTAGHVARHRPPQSRISTEIAVLDIAQDFLLANLYQQGILGGIATFKGGTALRKLFAGTQGRFSTDIDLAVVESGADRHTLAEMIGQECDVTLGPFRFKPSCERGRWNIRVTSALGNPSISIKLDVGPPCWLTPEPRAFVPHATQQRYGFDSPEIPCVRLEEIIAEKVARLTRSATARDASDLVWAATTSPHSQFGRPLVRRLAMLKVWVDNHGVAPDWTPSLAPRAFDARQWLAPRGKWDDEQIGLLTSPPPSLQKLESEMRRLYGWLADLDTDETRWATANPRDRADVIRAIQALPDFTHVGASMR